MGVRRVWTQRFERGDSRLHLRASWLHFSHDHNPTSQIREAKRDQLAKLRGRFGKSSGTPFFNEYHRTAPRTIILSAPSDALRCE